jgi:hypothetical protein
MRLRFAVLASVFTALVAVAAPGIANAAPRHNHGLTINATPNPIIAGEGVLIYGQLRGTDITAKTIALYHHVSGSGQGYVKIGHTTTDSHGFYEFTRAEGVVLTNRSWFVTEPVVHGVHSRTIHERVAALVSVSASPAPTSGYLTNHAIVFSGHVTPNHAFERVYLQEQEGLSGDDWRTLKTGVLGPGSNYAIAYRFRTPGSRDLRVVFRGDNRNVRGESDTVSVDVQQAQKADFTIHSTAPIIDEGTSATISGVLDIAGTSTPQPGVWVSLLGREDPFAGGHKFRPIGLPVQTATDGSYSFSVTPVHNIEYVVQTTYAPPKHRTTAVLFEGVRDLVSLAASATSSTVGGKVTFTGGVAPDKAGHWIELQRLGADGDYHTVKVTRVRFNSSYQFGWTFGNSGSKTFRTRIPGGPENVGGHSAPVTITVSPAAVSTLPPAS